MGRRTPSRAKDGGVRRRGRAAAGATEGRGQAFPGRRADVHSPTLQREPPTMGLTELTGRIAAMRGAGIFVFGAKVLRVLDGDGKSRRIDQANEIVYTQNTSTRVAGEAVEVEQDELPDVVLQVDRTADGRHRRLSRYEKWGFPEVWVEVPDRRALSGIEPASGLAIHLLTRVGYVQSPTSKALPSWSADEIHTALNEPERRMSAATAAALRRVGRLMRADTDADHVEANMEDRIEALDEMFRLRGFAVSPAYTSRVASLQCPLATLLRAAYDSRDEDDFLECIGVVHETPLVP